MMLVTFVARRSFVTHVLATLAVLVFAAPQPLVAAQDPLATCQKTVVKQLEKLKKIYLKQHQKCFDKENKLKIPGPCPDAKTDLKVVKAESKVRTKIPLKCTLDQLATIGYRGDCTYGPPTAGVDGQCAGLPVTTAEEFAECMMCWKEADFARYMAVLYASHAQELCGAVDDTSAVCSDVGCTSPLPEQRALGDTGENDCQLGVGKAGVRYMLKREKTLERCMLKGCARDVCLNGTCAFDAKVPVKLEKAESKLGALIQKKCGGNRVPSPDPNFCCRCGPMGGICMLVPDRATCLADETCQVQEQKVCNTGTGKCDNGPRTLAWWGSCPFEDGACPGTALATMDDLTACVQTGADEIIDELLCLQFPQESCPIPTPMPTP
jgi:hypothetical protein